jgi:hypothetical protein
MQMTKHRPRSHTVVSALAAAGLLVGALLGASNASASPVRPLGAAPTSSGKASAGPPAGAPITSPAPGQIFTPGSTIKLSAAPFLVSDAAKDGLSDSPVTSIKFYASTNLTNNHLVAATTSAPWTVQWKDVPAGDYSLTAVVGNKQGSTTSDPVAIQVEKPSVVTNQSALTVSKGQNASFGVTLSTKPAAPVTVSLNDSGTGSKVSKGQKLTFTPANWNRPQQVTVAEAQARTGSQRQVQRHHRGGRQHH